MTTRIQFALLLTAGLFVPADALAQGRPGGRGSGSGLSGGCRTSGTTSRPPASPSTSSMSAYPNEPIMSPPRSTSSAGSNPNLSSLASQQSAAQQAYLARQAYLAQSQAAQLRAYQARTTTPQTAMLQSAPVPYIATAFTPAAPRAEKPSTPKEAWKPPAEEPQYVPDELAVIKPDPVAVLATDSAVYDRYLKAAVAGDEGVLRDLDASGQLVTLSAPTEVAVLSRSGRFTFVRLMAGQHKDKTFVTRAKLSKPAAK